MSLLFLIAFIMAMTGELPAEQFTDNMFIMWALFSIADALWVGRCKK